MSEAGIAEYVVLAEQQQASLRIADLLSKGIFGLLLGLIVLTAIPYGTVEPWWKAVFVCLIFVFAIGAIVELLLSGAARIDGATLLLPMVALAAFAFLQTIPLKASDGNPGRISPALWSAISADPYQTRFFVLQLLALTVALAMLYRYANTDRRIRTLIYTIIAVAVASAIFGILRQTTQHDVGFILPRIKPEQGYGQFFNKNHFAFLMEMAFGLILGLLVAGGVTQERAMIYFASLLPIWTALVLANSRGGILAMVIQLVVAALLFTSFASTAYGESQGKIVRLRFYKLARSVVLRVVLLIVLIGGVLFGTLWVGGDRLISSFETVRGEFNPAASGSHDGASRNEIWRATLRMFAAHPILGVGLGGYWVAITRFHDASGTLTPQEAHNDYLELLSSGGVVGFALGIWFVIGLFRRTGRNLKSTNGFRRAACFGAALGITGVAVHSLVDFGLHMMANALLFIVLVMIATATIEPKNSESRINE